MNHRIFTLLCAGTCIVSGCSSDNPGDGIDPDPRIAACQQEFVITEPNPAYTWTPNAIELESVELGPGVFAVVDVNADDYGPTGIPLATSGGFVIGDDGVLLIETMINRQLFCQVMDLVRARTDKPILYAVNTSYHGDHSYGNHLLPDGAQVVHHEQTAAYIAEHFAADVEFMEANFGADQDIAEAQPVAADILVTDAGWSVDLGGKVVEAQYRGFAQTEGDLFVWVPDVEVLWTGNALVAEEPAIPWLLDGHAHDAGITLADVRASLPADAVIVPGHGRPIAPAGLDFAIDYLNTLVAEVQAAVDAGLDLQQTVEAVTMESFQGYALWDWLHPMVNIPSTHAELSATARRR